ncbi:hypothetical protein WMY93_028430 [Mugilogobius chulae]|uniref:Thromboxane-A synthase n=1 Tax=Mugilogobius chulae TaxID=88201 RepID=A0AAW0MUK6_9GOBI
MNIGIQCDCLAPPRSDQVKARHLGFGKQPRSDQGKAPRLWETAQIRPRQGKARYLGFGKQPRSDQGKARQECGIRHPKPMPFLGNMFLFREGFFKPVPDLIKTYGRVCGYYLGRRPVVVIADPDMLKEVLVRDFSNFPNRNSFRFATKPMSDCLLVLKNDEWKRVRSILTPSFSMVPLINTATNALMDNLNVYAESNEAFDIHKCFGYFTMDVIASVAFGTQVDSQNNPDDPFVHHAQMFLSLSVFRPIKLFFSDCLSSYFGAFCKTYPKQRRDQMNHFFISTIHKIIMQREEQPPEQRRRDFLQLMLDARRRGDESVPLEHLEVHSEVGPQTSTSLNKEVTGVSRSSNTLAFTCYLLALHPECQRRLQEEVDDFYTRHESPDYTNVQELKYLEMVISEALRMYPPGFRFVRVIEHESVVNGQRLPKGAWLEIPAGFLHHDPEHWPEPHKFIQRGQIPFTLFHFCLYVLFTPEAKANRHPFVYLPFGAGPRNCVGMRLALLEIKIALVNLFHRFSVVTCAETKVPLELKSSSTLGLKNGIYVKVKFLMDFSNGLFTDNGGWPVTFGLFLIFLSLLYWYSVYPFSVLSECGIRHPKPIPFLGNLFLFREGFFKPMSDLIKTYGRVCGYYLGRRPVVVIADPDMLKEVLVRDFSNFPNRNSFRFATKPMSDCLLLLKDDEWKRVRSILTPSFSAAKMKEMVPLINTATNALMDNLNVYAESNEAFDIHKCFGCFTMDVIASVAFGTQVDSQNNPDDPFVHHAQMFFSFSFFRPIMLFFIAFPLILGPFARLIPNKRRDQMNHFFINTIHKIIMQREEQPPEQRRRDFLQLMLDARSRGDESVPLEHFEVRSDVGPQTSTSLNKESNRSQSAQEPSSRRSHRKTMSEDEVIGQAFVFLLAGYETSSNTLAFTCYLLALHPECQRRLQEEVDDFYTRHESADYTNVQELKYLDMVISEALRMYPPGFRFARDIEHDSVVNGQRLPKGAWLEIPAGFLHHDPEHWPEPHKFIPERFTPEAKANRHPFVYLPFGAGPRNCVGMRLAQLEIKIALVNLFHRFSIVTCAETKVPLELKSSSTLGPKNGIYVKITKRESLQIST